MPEATKADDRMSGDSAGPSHRCCVVVGANAVSARRADSSDVPIVALVDAASPVQAVLAQAAGADIVLPSSSLEVGTHDDTPGLAMAVRAAEAIATRRRRIARSSRQVSHDLAEALNVIGLAADVATSGATPPREALAHITSVARAADGDVWQAGHTHRSLKRSLTVIDMVRVILSTADPADDVDVRAPASPAWVFADERHLASVVEEMVRNARQAGARHIRVDVEAGASAVSIIVTDDGSGFAPEQRTSGGEPLFAPHRSTAPLARAGLGLVSIAEFAADVAGTFEVADALDPEWSTCARLSIPLIERRPGELTRAIAVDQATAQADILEGVVRQAPLTESLDAIVTAIESQLPDTACSILLLRHGRSLHHGSGAKLPPAYRAAIDGVVIGRGQGSCGTAAHTGRPVVATDVTTDRNWRDFRDVATAHGLRSCWSTPIVAAEGGEVLGTFAVYKSSVWGPDQAAIRLVRRFTYLAAVAIEHHRLFGALAESESRFRSAFEGATAGLALAGLDGTLLKVNPSLATLLDLPESALVSTNMLDLVHPEARDRIRAAWDNLADTATVARHPQPTIEVPLAARPHDEEVWVSLSTSIVAAPDQRNFYVEVRDITASRRHLAEQRAREAAEASNRAKTDFLTLVSHELRTPLNAILGFAQVMQLADLDAAQRADGVDQIVSAGEHLRDLIDQLLDLSRIDAGQLSADAQQVDTSNVIGEALDLVRPLATSRRISLIHTRQDAGRYDVVADERCLRQVLINLLGNAVKYTPTGGRVAVVVTGVDTGDVRITVTDTGPGIAPDSLDQLFQPFHRLQPERDGRAEGTGLGLALTARLMAEMGGTIGVDSTVGIGSSFWVEFPPTTVAPSTTMEVPAHLPDPQVPDDSSPPGGVVLYIEDDTACVDVMRAALALRPLVALRTARTAADGVTQLDAGDIDLVLLDIGLPDRSGWNLLKDLRTTQPDLPVVVLTASTDAAPADAPHYDRLFTKPLDISDALRAIDLVLARSPGRDDIGQAMDPVEK